MKSFVDFNKEVLEEGKRADRFHIVNKEGKPVNLASYADKDSAVKDRDEKYAGAVVHQVGPRGKVKGVTETATMTDTIDEKLVGKQKKLDVNKNGKLDAEDFKKLRKEETDLDEADRGFRGVGGARDREDDEHHHLDNHNSTEKPKPYKVPKKPPVDFTKLLKQMRDKKTKLGEAKCKEDAPFEGGVASKGNVKDKSGAVHTPMSRARHAAKEALKKYSKEKEETDLSGRMVEDVELDEWKVESEWKRSDPEDKRSGQEKAKALAAKGATPSKLKPKKAFEEVELDEEINIFCEEMISHSDFHDKIAMHKKAGNNVVDYDHSEKKAHITTIDKEGMKRKVVYTPKGVSMQNMGQHQGDDKDETGEKIKKADTTGEKRGRGRPAGSKSGANLANAPAKRDFRGVSTHSLNISSNRSMREEVELDEAEMSPEMKTKKEKLVKGMKKSYSSFVSKYGDKAKNVMYATATKMAMKEETDQMEITHGSGRKENAKVHMTGSDYCIVKNKTGKQYTVDKKGNVLQGGNVNEETELEEAMQPARTTVKSVGTMKTVQHGNHFSIPLHPEHHQAIAKLKDNQEHKFKTEDGKHWTAKRMGDDVHFQGTNNGNKTKVPASSMNSQ